jgi:hypothetical protein
VHINHFRSVSSHSFVEYIENLATEREFGVVGGGLPDDGNTIFREAGVAEFAIVHAAVTTRKRGG